MEGFGRSDLACESKALEKELPGTRLRREKFGGIVLTRLSVQSETAAHMLEKPCGEYLTFECGRLNHLYEADRRLLLHLLSGELAKMAEKLTEKSLNGDFSVFVAGLGNSELTADAIGPKTVLRLTATRHLQKYEGDLYRSLGCTALSAVSPGVLGQTGIETSELLSGIIREIKPDLIVAVDALAARSCERLCSTVQLSSTGISPGSGVGNYRKSITKESTGIPVIAVGVPTVVHASTLVCDALEEAEINTESPILQSVLKKRQNFFVSPDECDRVTEEAADILASAIKSAFTKSF